MNPGRLVIAAVFALTAAPANIALAEDVITYELSLSNHVFSPVELKVPAGKPFKILLHNKDTTPAEFESKPLKIEKVVAGSADIIVNVRALEPGKYEFVDEYHEDETKGHVVAE
jgi:Cupredoxin-like domain